MRRVTVPRKPWFQGISRSASWNTKNYLRSQSQVQQRPKMTPEERREHLRAYHVAWRAAKKARKPASQNTSLSTATRASVPGPSTSNADKKRVQNRERQRRWRQRHRDQDLAERREVAMERYEGDPEYAAYLKERRAYRAELMEDLEKHGVPTLIRDRLQEALHSDVDAEIADLMQIEEDD